MTKEEINLIIKKEYPCRIETHSHTRPVSTCSFLEPEELVRIYKEGGYDAVTVTNHFIEWQRQDRTDREFAEFYLEGYRRAKEEGDKLGMTVILGAEVRLAGNNNDYLVYGIEESDIEWIASLLKEDYATFSKEFRSEKRLFLQAHPFRDCMTEVDYSLVDGIEAFNMHVNHNSRIAKSAKLAKENPDMIISCGSDAHELPSCMGGGILARTLPKDSFELADLIRSGDVLFTVGGFTLM